MQISDPSKKSFKTKFLSDNSHSQIKTTENGFSLYTEKNLHHENMCNDHKPKDSRLIIISGNPKIQCLSSSMQREKTSGILLTRRTLTLPIREHRANNSLALEHEP